MDTTLDTVLALMPLALIVSVLVPPAVANSRAAWFRQLVTGIVGLQCIVAVLMAVAYACGTAAILDATPFAPTTWLPQADLVLYDGVSSLMLALVSFVGWVICRYSIRYLDGERTQGQYFRWTGFTIGSVSMMVISGNLLMFVGCWVMTSLGLHQLLMHYGHRPAARRAAWTKFTVSRLGDAALLGAIAVIYSEFKTVDFAELFAAIGSHSGAVTPAMSIAGLLLIAGAVTKSAQFPFHTWLPQTMETPTPVSALMHAGVVNAGGYLIIRTSPLVSLTPWALSLLAMIGAVTAGYAAVVMLTQTNMKKSLAYSTIAQMGFMMLQCGLGAFSAAMLHIVAHSLYKAHAFLSSGSVMSQRAATTGVRQSGDQVSWAMLMVAGTMIVACFVTLMAVFGIDAAGKPGGWLLGGILCLALTHWVGQVMCSGNHQLLIRSLAIAGLLSFAYVISFATVDAVVSSSVPAVLTTDLNWIVAAIVLAGFAGTFFLQAQISRLQRLENAAGSRWMSAWYVHASNGFYLENVLRRVFAPLRSI